LGDFNIDILKKNNHTIFKKKGSLNFMDKLKLKSQFSQNISKAEFQQDHIWAYVGETEYKSNATKAYWLNFYIAFKLPNTLSMYNKRPLMFWFF
jgi:hypothetical protein